jgi:photosystem II stability/assembly factor-like uncharacterized protein
VLVEELEEDLDLLWFDFGVLRWWALVREDVAAVLREWMRSKDGDLVDRGERGRVMVFGIGLEEEIVRRRESKERIKRM